MFSIASIPRLIFGTPNDRQIKKVRPIVARINELEPEFEALSKDQIIEKTRELAEQARNGADLESLLPEAFANAREAGRRALGLRAFDVQLIGGIFLHRGNIAEMKTGEGKTLVATLPAYLNSLAGKGVHIVTVNDYLARRDAEWMGTIYEALGLSVGVIVPSQGETDKRDAYKADVTYATNNELGFDYLRDNMAKSLEAMSQRGHNFAIVDEVDSILIDEARTPLIISGPAADRSELYNTIDKLIINVKEEHYELDEKTRSISLSDEGNEFMEELLQVEQIIPDNQSLYDPESTTVVHHLTQALRAHKLFRRDKDYIVKDGQVVLIDEFTGRMMHGRRLSDGLHQAIEAKEGTDIKAENVTLASTTFQNYFRMYDKLAGMTGTAATEAEEFGDIYGLGVIEIPTNEPVAREDETDKVFRTGKEKIDAVVEAIRDAHEREQPVLVGTTSIDKSENLSKILKSHKISHNVLNARHHEQEARIIAEAGCPAAVTIATNMAGRGTDIQLGGNVEMRVLDAMEATPEIDVAKIRADTEAEIAGARQRVIEQGGLFVLATERHESRRIDNQLRGRSGRQGDPGRSCFYLSLEDDLLRIFGSERLDRLLNTLGMEEGEAIVSPMVNKSLEKAQAKVEARNFDIRKQILKYDDVMNDQRRAIFSQRREIMEATDVSATIRDMRHELIDDMIDEYLPPNSYAEQWEVEDLQEKSKSQLGIDEPVVQWADEDGVDADEIRERLYQSADEQLARKATEFGASQMRSVEKQLLLQTIDRKWREHLITLEHLRSVIGFRGYAQRDPLNEFKSEAFALFESLLESLRSEVSTQISRIRPMTPEEHRAVIERMIAQRLMAQTAARKRQMANGAAATPHASALRPDATPRSPNAAPGFVESDRSTWGNPGRNTRCPCGSGKKFKHCHGSPAYSQNRASA